ncbi:C40 family peptidase [Mangrovibacterium lignilyticum]|uniref:C40 family peptidase n=1 Tax=Mangrovibacterium lignilyticum TaxID=2668052 RepID=UPI0013D2E499|nr:C40 family peptidase [Mangrovibacterium lignilyticum]
MKNLIHSLFTIFLLVTFASCETDVQPGKVERVTREIVDKFAPDKRVAIFELVSEKQADGNLVLKGETNLPEAHDLLIDTLTSLNIEVVDSVRILPDEALGGKHWGLVTLSVIPMRGNPAYSAEMVSQTILGTPVKLLDKRGGWYRIQTPDLYIGWVSGSGLVPMTADQIADWKRANRYVFAAINGWVLAEPSSAAETVSDLVLGSLFEVNKTVNGYLQVQFPDKRGGYVKASECLPLKEWESIQPEAGAVIATARKLLGSPYLWGGTSTKGVDCSGFVKTAYLSQGVMLARDASQQAQFGEALDITDFQFEPGDLLFFGRSKDHITHVGLYIGDGHFIHSSGRVKINSFNPDDENYDPRRKVELVAARRVLNSLNNGQIIPIKEHSWYN